LVTTRRCPSASPLHVYQIDAAIHRVAARFPVPGYMDDWTVYREVALTASRYVLPGSRILDFGSGPCDKTAVLQDLGYTCSAYDDLGDQWHREDGNRERITAFARNSGIDFCLADDRGLRFPSGQFDMVMVLNVIEHLHDSPRQLMIELLHLVRPQGFLFVAVPNAVNVRKRVAVLLGRTNLPRFSYYYWCPGRWRGHVREYVRDDVVKLSEYLDLETCELRSWHQMLNKVPSHLRRLYSGVTHLCPGWRDSWLLVARKPAAWNPRESVRGDEMANIYREVFGEIPAWCHSE
jgi:SAM-dependent methyltransferase